MHRSNLRPNRRVAAIAALALALPAASSDPLAGRVAGPPQRCIDPFANNGPSIESGGLIVYRQSERRWWVTRPVGPCPALRPLNTLVIERWGTQLCRNDRFRVIGPGDVIPSASCRFDSFVPYTKTAK